MKKTQVPITQGALKIYKYNPLIKGKIVGNLTDFDFLLYEILFKKLQEEIRNILYFEYNDITLNIYMPELKKLLYDGEKSPLTWRRDVKNSLERLRNLTIRLDNYELPNEEYLKQEDNIMTVNNKNKVVTTKKIEYAVFGLCEVPEILDNVLYWKFSKYICFWAWYKKNYTHIKLADLRELKSKYAQRLYEYISLCSSIALSRKEQTRYISINKDDFENIIGIENSSVSVLFQKIHLDSVVLPELRKVYPKIEIKSPKRTNAIEIDLGIEQHILSIANELQSSYETRKTIHEANL